MAKVKKLSQELDRIFKDAELKNYMYKGMVLSVWTQAVGQRIAEMTQPQMFNNGTLYVKVQSAVWRNELSMMRNVIKEKINELLEQKIVVSIVFR
jgi:predicted nucleic acid-binding Zn ribbon protein